MDAAEKRLAAALAESAAPHLARAAREHNGCPEGDLECSRCGAKNASRNRQRTAYVKGDNMATLCPSCQEEADEYWDEMWSNVPGWGG